MNTGKPLRKATLILLLGFLLSFQIACKPTVVYLTGGEKVLFIEEGKTVSVPGPAWVTSSEGMAGYYDYLEDKVRAKEREND